MRSCNGRISLRKMKLPLSVFFEMLHQQPFFTEGHPGGIGRYPAGAALPDYGALDLPCTTRINRQMIRLPNFSRRGAGPLITQYAQAFREAMALM